MDIDIFINNKKFIKDKFKYTFHKIFAEKNYGW